MLGRGVFDYVWLIEVPEQDWPKDPRLIPIWRHGSSVLYRIAAADEGPRNANATAVDRPIPCYNEAALPCRAAPPDKRGRPETTAGNSYEIVLVNDGSRDEKLGDDPVQALAARDPHVLAINLSRNHGHQLALTAGLDLCSGERILIIDADLQDPPELLPAHSPVEMDEKDADVVYCVRRTREGETAFKKTTAKLFYRLLMRMTDVDIPVDTGDFRLMSRRALDALLALPEQARFIRGMVAWIGFRQVPLLYDRQERFSGRTNYSLTHMLRLAFDAVTGFSTAPLRMASHIGLWLVVASGGLLGLHRDRPDHSAPRSRAGLR